MGPGQVVLEYMGLYRLVCYGLLRTQHGFVGTVVWILSIEKSTLNWLIERVRGCHVNVAHCVRGGCYSPKLE